MVIGDENINIMLIEMNKFADDKKLFCCQNNKFAGKNACQQILHETKTPKQTIVEMKY